MADYTEAKRHLLRHDEPGARRWCGSTSAPAAARVVLEEGINGQMITLYDKGAHIPLLWTHLIPATLEGHGDAQRAERDVRGRDRLQPWA